ncbi:MAG: hypothetical protein ACRDRJ_16325 [Streptosporangiaceae bacterium]
MLSTRKIAGITRADRGRVTRLLREAGITVTPHGTGRRLSRRTTATERLDQLMARLYLEDRMSTTQIAELTGMPDHAVLYRLHGRGVPIRTRGRNNREDRTVLSDEAVAAAYVNTGLSADEAGRLLGVSGKILLRSAHDHGLPVRMGGAPPARGPSEVELLAILYGDSEVRRVLDRRGVPAVEAPGPISERFPSPHPLTEQLVLDLYEGCGLSLRQIELLTGRPAAAAGALLRSSGIKLRPAGGRSPFMRRWRADRT